MIHESLILVPLNLLLCMSVLAIWNVRIRWISWLRPIWFFAFMPVSLVHRMYQPFIGSFSPWITAIDDFSNDSLATNCLPSTTLYVWFWIWYIISHQGLDMNKNKSIFYLNRREQWWVGFFLNIFIQERKVRVNFFLLNHSCKNVMQIFQSKSLASIAIFTFEFIKTSG